MSLVNLSRGGALVQVPERYPMRSSVQMKLTSSTGEVTLTRGTVAWAKVGSIVGKQINYLVAVIFDEPLADLGDSSSSLQRLFAEAESEVSNGAAMSPAGATTPDTDDAIVAELVDGLLDEVGTFGQPGSNVTQFRPIGAKTADQPVAVPDDRVSSVPAQRVPDTLTTELRKQLAAVTGELEMLTALNQSMAAKLDALQDERSTLQNELEAERRQSREAQSRLSRELEAAAGRHRELEAASADREREKALALADQQARYEGLIDELMKAANDQQAEYQGLLGDLTRSRDDLQARFGQLERQFADERAAAAGALLALENRCRDWEYRATTAEQVCAAHEERHRAIRARTEHLMSAVSSPLVPGEAASRDAESTSAGPVVTDGGPIEAVA